MHVKRCGTHRIIESGLCRSIHQLENHNYGIWRTIGVELLPYVGVSHSLSVVTCSNCDTHTESSARLFTIRFNQASTSAAALHAILGSVSGVQQQKWMPGTFVGEQWWVTTSDSPSDE